MELENQYEQIELSEDITKNYQLLLRARERGEKALIETFEKRMNVSLQSYGDLAKTIGREAVYSSFAEVTYYGD